MFSEANVTYKTTGGSIVPSGLEFKGCFFIEHESLRGLTLVDSSTDIVELVGAGEIAEEIKAAQLQVGSSFYAGVFSVGVGELSVENLENVFSLFHSQSLKFSMLIFLVDADVTFVSELSSLLQGFRSNKDFYEAVVQYKKAEVYSLDGIVTEDNLGISAFTITGNGFETGDYVLVKETKNHNGRHKVTVTGDQISFDNISYVDETFDSSMTIEEDPQSYIEGFDSSFNDESGAVFSDFISVVVPTTESGWVGNYSGRMLKNKVHVTAAKRIDGPFPVSVNLSYTRSLLITLDDARAVFFKQPAVTEGENYLNDDNVLYASTSDIKTMAQSRTVNKALRLTNKASEKLIGDDKYPKNNDGLEFAKVNIARESLEYMKADKEIFDYAIDSSWGIVDGVLESTILIVDMNRIKIINADLTLTSQE